MLPSRIPETSEGIQGEFDVREFNLFARSMRNRGWLETDFIIKSGIDHGRVLELGPGPGYLGLEWLKKTRNTSLTGIEISRNMIEVAHNNARQYGLDAKRVNYVEGNAMQIPFPADHVDAVFSNGSLHEWEEPLRTFKEIHRVLKPGGRYCICDLRRDLSPLIKWFLTVSTRQASMKQGLRTSLQAAYTRSELGEIADASPLRGGFIKVNPFGISFWGTKSA